MVPIVDTLTGIAMAIVIVVGGTAVLGRELDVGVMVAFLFYIQRFFDPIRSLTMQYIGHAAGDGLRPPHLRGARRAGRASRTGRAPCALGPDMDGSVEFQRRHLRLRPEPAGAARRELQGARPARRWRWSGRPARARPSCMALAHRFYDVGEGQVLVGGHDVRDVTQD